MLHSLHLVPTWVPGYLGRETFGNHVFTIRDKDITALVSGQPVRYRDPRYTSHSPAILSFSLHNVGLSVSVEKTRCSRSSSCPENCSSSGPCLMANAYAVVQSASIRAPDLLISLDKGPFVLAPADIRAWV